METNRMRLRSGLLLLYLTLAIAALSLTHCDAERSMRQLKGPKHRRNTVNKNPKKKFKITKHLDLNQDIYSSNAQPYSVSSPFSLPPYESLPPYPLPDNSPPPFCEYPPPNTPSTSIPTPTGFQSSPPSPPYYYSSPALPAEGPPPSPTTITPGPPGPSGYFPTPTPGIVPGPPGSFPTPTPEIVPSPPGNTPGSPEPVTNPPIILPGPPGSSTSPPYYEPTPPSPAGGVIPGPPNIYPTPTGGTVPSPFQPPVVYPPPSVPPPPNSAPITALWCVAKPSVPDPIIQEAMNYACWSGADCTSIQPNGPCYEPNTVFAHASYAFNSYWQRSKGAGGNCEFGGTAMLVAVDPSFDGCHFTYN